MKHRLAVVAFGIVLAACGTGVAPATEPNPDPAASEPSVPRTPEPPRMGPDGPEPPDVNELVAYGNRHRDVFGGLYIDPPGGQSVVMLFTRDLEIHHEAVNQIVPGTRTRQVAHTEAALIALIESFDFEALQAQGAEMVGASVDVIGNRVELELKTNDPTLELSLELTHGGMLDVTVYPVPGEWANVESGDGWRLVEVVQAHGNEAYNVRAGTDDAGWADLWAAIGGGGERPAVDLGTEVVVSFAHGMGSSCPELRLDDVVIGDGVVFSRTSDPLSPRACTADLVAAEVFVVALARDALPAGGFTLQLSPEGGPGCVDCGFTPVVEVELP
jgi:hypothetical protein